MDKTTDLLQVTDKLYHIMLYQVQFTTSGCQSNYNKIMTTMAHPAQHPLFQNTNVLVYCKYMYCFFKNKMRWCVCVLYLLYWYNKISI